MFLDPGKLLVIGAVALVVLGPDRLPKVARTVGSLWHDFTRWRATLDEQVRSAFPDLPATHDIVAAVRSPVALLDRLAKESVAHATKAEAAAPPVLPADQDVSTSQRRVVSPPLGHHEVAIDTAYEAPDAASMN